MPCASGSAISRRGRSSGAGAPDLSARVQAGGIRFRGMESLGKRLVEGVAAQDPAAIAACFTAGAELRALTPRGLRERTGGDEAAALIAAWFDDSTELELVDSALIVCPVGFDRFDELVQMLDDGMETASERAAARRALAVLAE